MVTKLLFEKKSSTNDVDEGTDELTDMKLLEKESLANNVEKGTDELSDIKQAVVTIRRKALYNFEGQSKGSTGWFKLDNRFLKTTFSTTHSELYKEH